jgi:prepilin-type N-terminal cleavage/methylation domain-containing protein
MPPTARKGFTLIELLIVVVIIGILAAIAIPKFANTKDKAKIASMKADLHNFVTAQEGHVADYLVYATTVASTGTANATTIIFQPSVGNAVASIATAANGFNATMTNATLSVAKTCGVYMGNTPPAGMPAGTREGSVACW